MWVGDWKRRVVGASLGFHKNYESYHFACGLVEEEGGRHESHSEMQRDPGRLYFI